MTRAEELLGQIEYVKGGLPSWYGYHNIYLTNRRIIITSIRNIPSKKDVNSLMKVPWRDMLNPFREMVEVEKEMIRPIEEVLSKDKSTYAIRYDEMKSLHFSKDLMEIHISFYAHNKHLSFSFPASQNRSANRWKMIYNRINQMNICPSCQGKLAMGDDTLLYCSNCLVKYKLNISDFRIDFQNERISKSAFKNKSTGALLAISGTIFFIATLYTFYILANTRGFSFSDSLTWEGGISLPFGVLTPCFFIFPLFIIITGILVYSGSNSGKIAFGVLCILFGLACNFAALLLVFNDEEGAWAFNIIISGAGTAIIGYGILLIRSSMRKKIQYPQLTG
jgi:hypothetical protein